MKTLSFLIGFVMATGGALGGRFDFKSSLAQGTSKHSVILKRGAEELCRLGIPDGVSNLVLENSLKTPSWNDDGTAAVLVVKEKDVNYLFVFFQNSLGEWSAHDISSVESENFGKLGFPRSSYSSFVTKVVKWLPRRDNSFQVVIETKATKNGQVFTVNEALIIDKERGPMFR